MKDVQMEPNLQQRDNTRSHQQRSRGDNERDERAEQTFLVTDIAVRGAALLWDLQMQTARSLWRTQAKTAAMLGLPDYSDLFQLGDSGARRIFRVGAEQVLNSARQARDTAKQVQREIVRAAEQQTLEFTEELQDELEQIGRHAERGLQEFRVLAMNGTEKMTRKVEQLRDESHERTAREQGGGNGSEVAADELRAAAVPSSAESNTAPREHDTRRASSAAETLDQNAEAQERHGRHQEERHRARRGT
jgi:hypothetical protein